MERIMYTSIFIFILLLLFKKENQFYKIRNIIIYSILLLYVFSFYERYILDFHDYELKELIPLSICRINTFLIIFYLITNKTNVKKYIYYLSFLGMITMIKTDIPVKEASFAFLYDHLIISLAAFYLIVHENYIPTRKDLNRVFISLCIMLLLVVPLNVYMDANYFYLSYVPILSDWFPNIPFVLFISLYFLFLYLVMNIGYYVGNYIIEKRKNKIKIYVS